METLLLKKLQSFISENIETVSMKMNKICASMESIDEDAMPSFQHEFKSLHVRGLDEYINQNRQNKSFSQYLLSLIDKRNLNDVDVYKKGMIDRRLFSKIRSNIFYHPSKRTAIAFIIALELNVDEATTLLQIAGYSFNRAEVFDLIILFFIHENIYDLDMINTALNYYEIPTIGSLE